MKSIKIIGGILIALGIGCAAWGYLQSREADDALQAATDARAGKFPFDHESENKQRMIVVADRDARDFRAAAMYWFIAAGCTGFIGIGLCVAGARRGPSSSQQAKQPLATGVPARSKRNRILVIGAIVVVLAAGGGYAYIDNRQSEFALGDARVKLRSIGIALHEDRDISKAESNYKTATFAVEGVDRYHTTWIRGAVRATLRDELAAYKKEIEEWKRNPPPGQWWEKELGEKKEPLDR